jgi:hypothetical protein
MGTEKCPFCGQEIDAAATKCFFCGAELSEESVHKRLEQLQMQDLRVARRTSNHFLIKVLVILIFVGVIFFYGTSGTRRISEIGVSGRTSTVKLRAKVTFQEARFIVYNNDSFDWKNVKLEIITPSVEGRFGLNVPIILSGETYKAEAVKFLNEDGIRFDPDEMEPREFWILCDTSIEASGSYLTDWK